MEVTFETLNVMTLYDVFNFVLCTYIPNVKVLFTSRKTSYLEEFKSCISTATNTHKSINDMPHSKTPGGSGASAKFQKQQAQSSSHLDLSFTETYLLTL